MVSAQHNFIFSCVANAFSGAGYHHTAVGHGPANESERDGVNGRLAKINWNAAYNGILFACRETKTSRVA